MQDIRVIINHSKLKREVYDFWLQNQYHLILDGYRLELRESSRHKFRATEEYSRLDNRYKTLKEEQVILFPEIIELAKKQLFEQIKVHKWNDKQN